MLQLAFQYSGQAAFKVYALPELCTAYQCIIAVLITITAQVVQIPVHFSRSSYCRLAVWISIKFAFGSTSRLHTPRVLHNVHIQMLLCGSAIGSAMATGNNSEGSDGVVKRRWACQCGFQV
jgi:hypothetical protein